MDITNLLLFLWGILFVWFPIFSFQFRTFLCNVLSIGESNAKKINNGGNNL